VLEFIEDVTSPNVAMVGGEGKGMVETHKKPAKVTRRLIEAARATKTKQDANAVTLIASVPPTGKRKPLECEGAYVSLLD
jgi:hypothetical protein